MDSFIFKGKSSLEFENLVVCNIPPITKPPKRTEIIEIDGKDGNIINELGYKSYEKEVTLFRKGDIDVDKLAEWLNGTGKLIFSNEEDKYYNATVINQIDFPRFINYEYIKVIFQIQPFKYSNLDENIIFNCKSVLDRCTIASINAAVGKLKNVKVYGELEQDTKVSSNILKSFGAGETSYFASLANVYTSDTNYYKAEPLADSWIHVECDMTSVESSGNYFINHFIPSDKLPKLKTSTTYTIIYEFRNVDITKMSGNLNTLRTQGTTFDNYFSGSQTITNANIQKYNNSMYKITKATLSEFSGNIALRNFHTITAGDKFSYDYRISVLEGDKLSQDYTYEEYANRPSPEEEARINTAGYFLNLFDNSVGGAAGEYLDINGNVATGSDNLRYTDYIKLPFDAKKLAVSGMTTGLNAPAICFYDKDRNFISGIKYDRVLTKIIDVPTKAYFFRTSYRTINTKFQIEKGIIIHDYIPPNTRGILYENIGKNYFDFSKTILLYSTTTVVTKEKNTLQIKGSANTYRYYRVTLKVKAGTYTFQRKWKVISGVGDTINGMLGVININQGYNGTLLMNLGASDNSKSFTVTEDCELDIIFYISGKVALTEETEVEFYDIQIEKGTKATDVEVHKEINSVITLPENEFMGKIDTYEDYIEGNILHKRIGKLVLDGTENWLYYAGFADSGGVGYCYQIIDSTFALGIGISKCSHFRNVTNSYMGSIGYVGSYCDHLTATRKYFISDKTTLEEWKSWLAEQYANGTPVEIYYVLAEEYTVQLDEFELPLLEGINNISSDSEIEAEYYNLKKLSVNNVGLQKSLPIIKLKGEGISSLHVNSIEQFIYKFPTKEDNSVIIDSIEQEAYYDGILKNRNMNGEFPELNPGSNEITWTGDIDEFEINPKSRWL